MQRLKLTQWWHYVLLGAVLSVALVPLELALNAVIGLPTNVTWTLVNGLIQGAVLGLLLRLIFGDAAKT